MPLDKDTLYRTGYTKQLLFWAFSMDGEGFIVDDYWEFLGSYMTRTANSLLYNEYFCNEDPMYKSVF